MEYVCIYIRVYVYIMILVVGLKKWFGCLLRIFLILRFFVLIINLVRESVESVKVSFILFFIYVCFCN